MYSSFCRSWYRDTLVYTGIYGNDKLHDQDLKHETNFHFISGYTKLTKYSRVKHCSHQVSQKKKASWAPQLQNFRGPVQLLSVLIN